MPGEQETPITKDFTFFSNRHQSWSRIDACWTSTDITKELEEIEIKHSTREDHNPIYLIIGTQNKNFQWRLNITHLTNEDFVKQLKDEMDVYFKQIMIPETSISTVWEASKCVARYLLQERKGKEQRRLRT